MLSRKILLGVTILFMLGTNTARSTVIPKGPAALKQYKGDPLQTVVDYDTLLFHDNGSVQYYFPLPDEWDDHFFNVRFSAPDSCRLVSAEFHFILIDEDTTEMPDIYVFVDRGGVQNPTFDLDTFPDSVDVVIEKDGDSIILHTDSTFTLVEFDSSDVLVYSPGQNFHIGWEPADTTATDTLAILSDDGIPETDNSMEFWGQVNAWKELQTSWGIGVNFLIRALVEVYEDTSSTYVWLEPDNLPADFILSAPYPNPFNPETSLVIQLQKPQTVSLNAYDLTGRLVDEILHEDLPAGRSLVHWKPQNLPSGTYLVKLTANDRVVATRATLLR